MRLVLVVGVVVCVLMYATSAQALTERSGLGTGATSKPRAAEGQGGPRPLALRSVSARHLSPRSLWRAFLCIHRHEGSWTDPRAPYYGGLQMDLRFQRTYGREFLRMWGTANRWPAAVQMAVAMRAYEKRGFSPWPATARRCGLL